MQRSAPRRIQLISASGSGQSTGGRALATARDVRRWLRDEARRDT